MVLVVDVNCGCNAASLLYSLRLVVWMTAVVLVVVWQTAMVLLVVSFGRLQWLLIIWQTVVVWLREKSELVFYFLAVFCVVLQWFFCQAAVVLVVAL
jgi:hypothetical protein